jgi:hydrogenase-4 component E
VLLGIVPLFVHPEIGLRGILLIIVTIGLKGFVIPGFLVHAMREAEIQHEVNPVVNYMSSLLLGAVGTGLAMVFSYTLPLAEQHSDLLIVPASLATVWTGFLLLTTRRKAIMQVVGYLLLENGIFLFGLLLLEAMPFLVEIGVLLDLFTGVFVMGIIIHHISREFASISTVHLAELKE